MHNGTNVKLQWEAKASVDASDLDLAPGEWPERLSASVMGGLRLELTRVNLTAHFAEYFTEQGGCRFTLTVFND